jgi:hypothetical protein
MFSSLYGLPVPPGASMDHGALNTSFMETVYRSLDYMDNVRALHELGYRYLTFHAGVDIPCEDLASEPGYEDVIFREAVPSLKPVADESINLTCLPIGSEEVVMLLDSDVVSYQVEEQYFTAVREPDDEEEGE